MTSNSTTLVCLFHHQKLGQAAIHELVRAGIAPANISVLDESGSTPNQFRRTSLKELEVPSRDQQHLLEGVAAGGVLVAVTATEQQISIVERIFGGHEASKIDEAVKTDSKALIAPTAALSPAAGSIPTTAASSSTAEAETAIPIIEEELVVGKRSVDRGGVRVYRRIVEIPVEQSVSLHEEHVNVERRPVNRAVTAEDLNTQGEQTIELLETAEQAVISKSARVVEEVVVGKIVTEHTQAIHDTVRKTEVAVEKLAPDESRHSTSRPL